MTHQSGAERLYWRTGPSAQFMSEMRKETEPLKPSQRKSQPATPPERVHSGRRGKLAGENYEGPAGVQGANVGYWQARGVTRAGAKRSKRP